MPIDTQQIILGTQIALLDKYYPGARLEEHIFKGLSLARKIMLDAEIASDLGTSELAVSDEILNRIFSQSEWAAKQGVDKNLSFVITGKGYGEGYTLTYTVPATKKLYLTQASFLIFASAGANGDLNQMGTITIYNHSTSTWLAHLGGNGGGQVIFPKPVIISGGEILWLGGVCRANHDCDMAVSCMGYEI